MIRTFGYKRQFESPILEVLTKLRNCVSSYTYEEFFSGYDFPNLIQQIYNEKIPNITWLKRNELTKLIFDTNNIFCFEFLKKKEPNIFSDKPYETKDDKIKIIELFFNKVIYKFDIKKMMRNCKQIIPFGKTKNPAEIFYSYEYFIALVNKLFNFDISYGPIDRCNNNIKLYHKFPFILDAVHGDLFDKTNKIFYLIQINEILKAASFYDDKNQEKFKKEQEMDPICIFLKYKRLIKSNCESIDQIFDEGYFPSLIESIVDPKSKEKIPNIIEPKNEFDIIKNNLLALKYLSSKTTNLIQEGHHFRTTQERFDLLQSIIMHFYNVNPNRTFRMYNKKMPNKFHINDINELFTVHCFFRYFCYALYYENICYYDNAQLAEFDEIINDEVKINTGVSNDGTEYGEGGDPKFSYLPIFIKSCFYKSDKYRFLILLQFDYLTHFRENTRMYEYHYEDPYLNDNDNNERFYEEDQKDKDDEMDMMKEKQRKKNLLRKNNEKSIYYPDANFLEFHNLHFDQNYNLYHSYNPYFHFKFERAHPISTFYPSDDEAVYQDIENKIQDGFIKKPQQKVEDDNLKSDEIDNSYDIIEYDDDDGNVDDEFHNVTKDVLLKTINVLCKSYGAHFDDFNQTVKKDSIPKFVKNVLKLKKMKYHHHHHLNNIEAVIHYLQSKEPRFLTLVFDFKTKELIESSAILFYSQFLNHFFLKKTKEELFKRCIDTLNIKKCNKYNLLTDYNTYLSLAYLVNHSKLKKTTFSIDKKAEKIFEKAEIPCLFDDNFLQILKSKHKLHDVLYYQLQFIFDAIDDKKKPSKIDEKQPTNKNKVKVTDKYANDKLKYPLTFKERLKLYKLSVKNKDSNGNFETNDFDVEPAEEYWNFVDFKSSFDDGVLVISEEDKKPEDEWIIKLNETQPMIQVDKEKTKTKTKEDKKSKKKKTTEPEKKMFNDKEFITKEKLKPFKLFIYNEKKAKWCFNKDDFDTFCEKSMLNSNDIPTPLILYINSFEKDLITINSNFINHLYPDLNDKKDQIFVYALCDRSLNFLSYQTDIKDIENSKIKPIFLLLHVPESKKNHPEIKKIVVQIYSFLAYICDIEIVVMNKLYYKEQIAFTKIINDIFPKKDDNFVSKSSILNSNNDNDSDSEEEVDEISNDDDVDDFEEEDDENDEKLKDDFNEFKIISKIPIKTSKIIILGNDLNVHDDATQYNKFTFNTFLNKFTNKMKNLNEFHFININEPVTYEPFLENLKNFVLKSDTIFGEILARFKLIQMSELTNSYIQIKTQKMWKDKLNDMIMNRKSMYKIDESCNPFIIILRIKNELSKIASHYDLEFYQECNSVFSEIEKDFDKNRDLIKVELNRSSSKYLDDLKKVKDYELFDKKTTQNLNESHINFLKKEYFDIVKSISQSDNFASYYETNIEILNEFIENGLYTINELRKNIKQKFKQQLPPENEDDFINGSTNYEIRQKENIKEIKIQFSFKDGLEGEIDQDF